MESVHLLHFLNIFETVQTHQCTRMLYQLKDDDVNAMAVARTMRTTLIVMKSHVTVKSILTFPR